MEKDKNNSTQENTENKTDVLAQKDAEISKLQKELAQKKNSDDIAPGIRKTHTFGANYRNGYSDGTVKKERERLKKETISQVQR